MKVSTVIFSALTLAAFAGTSQAQSSSVTVGEYATVAAPIRLTKVTDLNFGGIIQGSTAGNVVVSATGGITFPVGTTGPVAYNGTNSGVLKTVSAATFTVTGEPNLAYCITAPTTSSVKIGSSGPSMNVTLGKPTGAHVNLAGTSSTIQSNGTDAFSMGGTLAVGAGQASGAYAGSFQVTVAYQ